MSVEPRPTGVLRYPFDLSPSDSPAEREDSTEKHKGRRLKTVTNLARNPEIERIVLQPATDG